MRPPKRLHLWLLLSLLCFSAPPTARGQPANFTLDFETGTLQGWQKTGNAFDHQPTLGDNPTARHRGQPARYQGRYWIGTYERYQGLPGQEPGNIQGDGPKGTLTSAPFTISSDYLKFLIGGGAEHSTRVELLILDPIEQTYIPRMWASGSYTETMHRVAWNIAQFKGKKAKLRIVDDSSKRWGHINADDFKFYENQPVPNLSVKPRIIPDSLSVKRGETALFRSSQGPTHGASITQDWRGPGGQRAQGPVFRIDTSKLAPDTYQVFLKIINRSSVTAHLPVEAQATLRVLPVAIHYSLALRIQPGSVEEKKPVTLAAILNPPSPSARYRFSPGDDTNSGWITSSSIRHYYQAPGQYRAIVYVKPGNDQLLRSKTVFVRVVPRSYKFKIRADKASAGTDEVLRFSGRLLPETSGVRYRCFFGDGQASPFLAQPDVTHRYGKKGQFQVICEVYVDNRQVKSNRLLISIQEVKYRINLRAEPDRVFTGRKVHFTASASPFHPEMQYLFIFGDNKEKETGYSPRAEHVYSNPGTYYVQAVARLKGKQVAASSKVQVTAENRQPAPLAQVAPGMITVPRGKVAKFTGTALPESAKGLAMKWSGPTGQGGAGKYFDVKTSSLDPGTYKITLSVNDRFGRSAKARANLKVVPVTRTVFLKVNSEKAREGQPVRLEAYIEPEVSNAEYNFYFGDNHTSGWLPIGGTSHKYTHHGRYCSYVEARLPDGTTIQSKQSCLEIRAAAEPAPPHPEPIPKLVLKVKPSKAEPGQEIRFLARLEPNVPDVEYKFLFGDRLTTDWGKQASVRHRYTRDGTYQVQALARGAAIGNIKSRDLLVRVKKSNLLFWIIGILFAASYGLYRIRKGSKNDKSGAGPLSVVKIHAAGDPGSQQVLCGGELKGGTEIRIRSIMDDGRQDISGDETVEENNENR